MFAIRDARQFVEQNEHCVGLWSTSTTAPLSSRRNEGALDRPRIRNPQQPGLPSFPPWSASDALVT